MSRDYTTVKASFWTGKTGRALRKQGMEAQIVALYLLINSHDNMLGLYYMPLMYIAHETGLSPEEASKGLAGAIEAGFCHYDEASEFVWVIEMAAHQIAESLEPNDKRVRGIQTKYNSIPENPFLAAFYQRYKTAFHMSSCRGNSKPLTRGFEGASEEEISPLQGAFPPLRSQNRTEQNRTDTTTSTTPAREEKPIRVGNFDPKPPRLEIPPPEQLCHVPGFDPTAFALQLRQGGVKLPDDEALEVEWARFRFSVADGPPDEPRSWVKRFLKSLVYLQRSGQLGKENKGGGHAAVQKLNGGGGSRGLDWQAAERRAAERDAEEAAQAE